MIESRWTFARFCTAWVLAARRSVVDGRGIVLPVLGLGGDGSNRGPQGKQADESQ